MNKSHSAKTAYKLLICSNETLLLLLTSKSKENNSTEVR